MRNLKVASLMLALMMALLAASCGGAGVKPGPGPGPGPDFTRMTAVVLDASGKPLPGLGVRVDGQPTGVETNAAGQFTLTAADFPNGAAALAELTFGKGGIVIGSRDVVPADNPTLNIKFDDPATGGTGTGNVSGMVYDSGSYGPGPTPMLGMPDSAGNMPAFVAQPLDGVEVTLFNAEANAVFQTKSSGGGHYSIDNVSAGMWQIVAQKDNYYPEMGAIKVADAEAVSYDIALTSKGTVLPGEGFTVSGVLKDSKTGAPIAGATVNLYADTGYWGIMVPPTPGGEPGSKPDDPSTGNGGGGTTIPSAPPMASDVSTDPAGPGVLPPDYYRPQSMTTTTAADGTFAFAADVNGYSLWLDYHADGYLAGNHYEDITGRTTDLSLNLTMDPLIATGVHGHVADASGNPVKGAHVNFIFGQGGGPIAMPGFADFGGFASDGSANFDKEQGPVPGQTPPPAPVVPGGWDANGAPAAGGDASSPASGGGSTGTGNGFDNEFMQRFLWDQQHKGASAVPSDFSGFVSQTTDANGDYSTTDIPAGHYYVMVDAYKHLPYSGEAELTEDAPTNVLDVTLPVIPVGSVEGQVTDEGGAPLDETLVNATQPYVDPFTFTDATGHFRIDNVPTGQWVISAFKSGFITSNKTVDITENGVVTVNLVLHSYQGGARTTIGFGGSVINGSDNSTVSGADIVFTPGEPELGGYARHLQSAVDGTYSTTLVPQSDYSVLVQKDGYEDIFFRIWTDEFNPRMDFWLWPIGAAGGRGGWNGGGVVPPGGGTSQPPKPGDPTTTDPNGNTR